MDNFFDTSRRMYKSSCILHDNFEYHNACYLAGYVIECYAKIIVGLSYGLPPQELKEFGHDLKKLRIEFEYILAHSSYSVYMVDMRTDFSEITRGGSKWNPIRRYADSSNAWNITNSANFLYQIELAMEKLEQMNLDGHTLI